MALSKEFYLDEIRSKYPNSYNEGLKDLPVKDLEDMLDFLDQALGKADGGAIGIEVLFTEKKPRKNFFMGGPALEGPALSIYNSMSAYGFTDQEIANAIKEAGYELPTTTTTTTPVTNTAPNIINQDRNGDGPPPPGPKTFDKGFSSQNFGLGPNKDVVDYEAEAYGIGPTFKGQIARAFSALSNIPTPFNIARMGIEKAVEFAKQKKIEKQRQEEAAAKDLAREIQRQNIENKTGGYQFGYSPSSDFMSGGSQGQGGFANTEAGIGAASAAMGSSKDGGLMGYGGKSGTPKGLATMFTRRR